MPSLVRKYLIYAAVDGLILQPLSPSRNAQQQHAATPGLSPPLKIEYKSHAIVPVKGDDSSTAASLAGQSGKQGPSLEGFGVVGLLNVSSHAFLISISQRQQVGQIRGKPIYAVTDVAVIPLSSQSEANDALTQAKDSIRQQQNGGKGKRSLDDSDEDESEDDRSVIEEDELQDDDLTLPTTPDRSESRAGDGDNARQRTQSTVAEDVMTRKGMYGRFAERWFSRRGWSVEKRRMQGMSTEESEKDSDAPETVDGHTAPSEESPAEPADTAKEFEAPTEPDKASDVATAANKGDEDTPKGGVTLSLLPKLLRTTKMLFGSRNFFFSYDYDITHSVGTQRSNASNLPLHRIADSQYFWNRHISLPFIRSSQDAFVLPVMQGFVGQCSFAVQKSPSTESADKVVKVHEDVGDIIEDQENPEKLTSSENAEKGFLLTLISRRSVERAGLRYLRRGVDDLGHAANTVETEQILSSPTWDQSEKTYSFTQLRGSIPLYFSQSPYAFKPVPELHHSSAANYEAFRKHFANIGARYGKVQVATLIEKHGNEGRIGEEYEKNASKLNADGGVNGSPLGFEWFDFHDACRGMKFENVSMLVDKLGETISEFGSTVQHNGKILSQQTGVLRTNCMDCLDRTNVAQSAFAKQVLDSQLMSQGFDLKLQSDQTTQWFNTIWADHGDAISKQYSSTAALKGDYTRTRKRDYRGALNDFGLTLSRYYNNIVNDYFSQAVIDYLQGSVNAQVFEDFEANMMSVDPAISVDKVRQNAIDTSAKIVVADQTEELIGGWALSSPSSENTLRTLPFTETILLLTDAALYAVRFDWHTEKVASFERVDLRHVLGLQLGTYITSTLAAAQTDARRNVGFVVRYRPGREDIVRVNTRSLKTDVFAAESKTVMGDDALVTSGPPATGKSNAAVTTSAKVKTGKEKEPAITPARILAFKALPTRSSLSIDDAGADGANSENRNSSERSSTELDTVRHVCEEIERAALAGDSVPTEDKETEKGDKKSQTASGDTKKNSTKNGLIEEKDIISLAEAKKSTGLLEQLGYQMKKLVWA